MIEIRKPVTSRKKVDVKYVKPALYASKCEGCGKIYKMGGAVPVCSPHGCGILRGIFDQSVDDPNTGKGLGNMFHAEVCSFECAQKVMDGGWHIMKEYKPFLRAKANLVRCELEIHSAMKTEAELLAEWQKAGTERVGDEYEPRDHSGLTSRLIIMNVVEDLK